MLFIIATGANVTGILQVECGMECSLRREQQRIDSGT